MDSIKINSGLWKRLFLFSFLNISLIVTLLFITNGDIIGLLPFLLIYSCTMPFVSLLFSKRSAKKAFNLFVFQDDQHYSPEYEWYFQTTHQLATKAGFKKMPEVAIYESSDMNAFATGRSKNSSLIAISSGLLHKMDSSGIEAVIAHEIAHIKNGDMVTQTLLQAFINILLATILLPITFYKWASILISDRDTEPFVWLIWLLEAVVTLVLLFFANLILKMYSRKREFGADFLAARLTNPQKMMSALQQLHGEPDLLPSQRKFATSQFNGRRKWLELFSTHPSVNKRIKNLQKKFNLN
ncbi:zinc metalloprotease HtpX [Exiguobacterium acetylicum]|uniref:zinc metalloprotease HtpX n=1 Tax=Exiguobacterium acetylicum TaxID=41170 RepID=UPI001EE2646A|nr:zinc metalloprotease HtpX [Exiguobacterium acetylicum]UKS55477.1 M48 family metalloprotease [Exiguobacterium acetylicum]